MKQYEAVVQTMESLGGLATLGEINHNIFKIKDCEWKTKTPFASIRRIVQQTPKFIYKIKPGLYGLERDRKKHEAQGIFPITEKNKDSEIVRAFSHYYYQGLLVDIGNLEGYGTYAPPQDQNQAYNNKRLGDNVTIKKILNFGYDNLVQRARTIDVIYFNERNMPSHFYEVEHSTDIQNSLGKFVDLQDYNTQLYIVADIVRKKEYESILSRTQFKDIKGRVRYIDYEYLADIHAKTYAINQHDSRIFI